MYRTTTILQSIVLCCLYNIFLFSHKEMAFCESIKKEENIKNFLAKINAVEYGNVFNIELVIIGVFGVAAVVIVIFLFYIGSKGPVDSTESINSPVEKEMSTDDLLINFLMADFNKKFVLVEQYLNTYGAKAMPPELRKAIYSWSINLLPLVTDRENKEQIRKFIQQLKPFL